uniref:fimbrial protein n=1 Tax=Bordetella sputigena TaxID=1416810 RepID=UPI0039EF3A3A
MADPAEAGAAAGISRLDAQPGGSGPEGELLGCPVVPTAASEAADSMAGGLALDYVPLPPGSTPVKWGRPLGTPKPWFSSVTPEGGMQLGERSLTYRGVDGPSVSLGSLTPFAPAWSSAATIGGVQVSNLTASSDSTVPEGKLGYSSVWGRINNTDPAVTAGGVQYGAPAGSNAVRYGLTPDLTLEGQVQSARALTTTGLGTTYSMGEWGTLQGGATQSHFDTAQGRRYNLGYNVKVFDAVRLGYGNELTSSGYGDLSTYQDGTSATSQWRNTFSAGVPISGWGELSGTYSGLRDTSGEMLERRYGISQSMMLSPNVRLAVGADHDVITGDYGVNMQLTMPLGGR